MTAPLSSQLASHASCRSGLLAAAVAAACLLAGCDRNPDVATNNPREDGAVAMGAGTDGTGVTSTDNPGGLAGTTAQANADANADATGQPQAGAGGAGLVGATTTTAGRTTNGNGIDVMPGPSADNRDALDQLPATAAGVQPAPSGEPAAAATLAIADRNFLAQAAQGGLFEVEAGRLANQKASHSGVKALGATLSSDHSDAAQRLRDLAAAKGVTLPTTVSQAQRETLQKLNQASGAEFDRVFLTQVGIDAHQRDIAAFERAAREAKDAEVKAFASSTLPTLRHHFATAQQLQQTQGQKP